MAEMTTGFSSFDILPTSRKEAMGRGNKALIKKVRKPNARRHQAGTTVAALPLQQRVVSPTLLAPPGLDAPQLEPSSTAAVPPTPTPATLTSEKSTPSSIGKRKRDEAELASIRPTPSKARKGADSRPSQEPKKTSAKPAPPEPAYDRNLRHKRTAPHPAILATDIYVSRSSNARAQTRYAQKLIDGRGFTSLTVHGLGAALKRAIELALHLQKQNPGRLRLAVTTSSVTLADDVEPENDDDLKIETRQNSAVHIRIVKVTNDAVNEPPATSSSVAGPAVPAPPGVMPELPLTVAPPIL
ncbi:ribonucleases P/MRP protein subunit pop7 [Thoreauomyces humboldtii]|nr:ribonucleases P/MRP protein subunit pop7 [Thoreauomyces humboldtii]